MGRGVLHIDTNAEAHCDARDSGRSELQILWSPSEICGGRMDVEQLWGRKILVVALATTQLSSPSCITCNE